jgi:hypothetical protein
MTAIAAELDKKLQTLDPQAAAYVEQLVREALQQAEKHLAPTANAKALAEHQAHIAKFAGIWAGEDFERPQQGEFEKREDW